MTIRQTLHHLNLRSTRLLPKFNPPAKIILILISLIGIILLTQKTIAAEDTSTNTDIKTDNIEIDASALSGYYDKQKAIDKGNNQEAWINESLSSNAVSINRAIAGNLPENLEDIVSWRPGGLIGFTNHAIASLYQPPASGVQYIAQSINSFLGKPAYAATGFGFDKLNGILDMWKTMRNAVYTIISLFFIITGIMIMLRVKLSPQTTVTIQSAIPGIISSLILVTFSYAIAGLIIDISNVFLGIVLSLINTNWGLSDHLGAERDLHYMMTLGFWDFIKIANGFLVTNAPIALASGIGAIIGIAVVATAGSGILIGVLTTALILSFVYIFAFIQIIKLFFGLAKSYINVIIQIILGPIQIGMGAIPGSKINFSTWLTQLIAHMAVFPSTTIFLVFSIFLTQTVAKTDSSISMWSPTMLGYGGIISAIVGLACLSILSKIPDLVPELIFSIKPSPIGKTIGDTYKWPTTMAKAGISGAVNSKGQQWMDEEAGTPAASRTPTIRFLGSLGRLMTRATHK